MLLATKKTRHIVTQVELLRILQKIKYPKRIKLWLRTAAKTNRFCPHKKVWRHVVLSARINFRYDPEVRGMVEETGHDLNTYFQGLPWQRYEPNCPIVRHYDTQSPYLQIMPIRQISSVSFRDGHGNLLPDKEVVPFRDKETAPQSGGLNYFVVKLESILILSVETNVYLVRG